MRMHQPTAEVIGTAARSAPAPRIALYSHDTVGLGHTRRNIAVATSLLSAWPDADALLITGNPEATSLCLPPRTDVVTVPTLAKDTAGHYRSRTLNAPVDRVISMRSAVIEAALTSFSPDLLIVDKVPLGVAGELAPSLRRLRAGGRTRIVLGLREILDDPVTAVAQWTRSGSTETIDELYDAVWVYGDQRVYDPIVEYGLPAEVSDRCTFTGYLGADRFQGADQGQSTVLPTDRPYVLCTVGGGQDGAELATAFAGSSLPADHDGVVVCGPYMSGDARATVHRVAEDTPRMTVLDFVPDLHRLIDGAAAVVSMAGYNSACEVLAADRPALLVPRTRPRTEQLVRAQRLSEIGAVDMLPLDRLTGAALSAWSARAVTAAGPAGRRADVDVDGLRRLPLIAEQLLARRLPNSTGHRGVDHRAA